jgi:hypothetical protein
MAAVRTITLHCDRESARYEGEPCGSFFTSPDATEAGARRDATREGWRQVGGQDVCPLHVDPR